MEKTRENTIDTCGLSCPQPALEVLNFIQQNGADTFSVLTDSVTSREILSAPLKNIITG